MNKNKIKSFGFILLKIFAVFALFFLIFIFIGNWYINSHKVEISNKFNAFISEKINASVKIQDFDLSISKNFGNINVNLKNILITDSLFNTHKKPLLKANLIQIQIPYKNLFDNILEIKYINISEAEMNVFTFKNLYTNKYIFKTKTKNNTNSQTYQTIDLKKIECSNCQISIKDEVQNKLFEGEISQMQADFNFSNQKKEIELQFDILSKEIAFNTLKGGFLRNSIINASPKLILDSQKLRFDEFKLSINNQDFEVAGFFNIDSIGKYLIKIDIPENNWQKTIAILPQNIQRSLTKYNIEGLHKIESSISGQNGQAIPKVFVKAILDENNCVSPFIKVNKLSSVITFNNQFDAKILPDDSNSEIKLLNFNFDIQKLPISGKYIMIQNFDNPFLKTQFSAIGQNEQLENIFGNNSIDFIKGNFKLNLNYEGFLMFNTAISPTLRGDLHFYSTELNYVKNNLQFKDINSSIQFLGKDVKVNNLSTYLGSNKLNLQLYCTNLVSVLSSKSNISTKINVKANQIHLENMMGFFKKSKVTKKSTKGIISFKNSIDKISNFSSINYTMQIDNLYYKKMNFKDVNVGMTLNDSKVTIQNLQTKYANGLLYLKGDVLLKSDNSFQTNTQFSLSKVNVRKVFKDFDQMGIKSMKDGNLEGNLDVKSSLSANLDSKGNLQKSSLNGNLFFSLKNGQLKNFKPLTDLSNAIVKKDKLQNIRFNEINNTISIKGTEFFVPEMEFQSNVWQFFIKGNYSFSSNTDFLISIPVTNLLKKNVNVIPEKTGINNAGKMLYVKALDKSGKMEYAVYTNKNNAEKNLPRDKRIENTKKVIIDAVRTTKETVKDILDIFRKKK